MRLVGGLFGVILVAWPATADALQLLPRTPPISGRIVARKSGETAVLQPSPAQRPAEVRQDLKAGDVLRTYAAGTLAIVFADRTQIRLGRNAVLLVKAARAGAPSQLELRQGALWGRAERAGTQLSIETPAANAGIRGTSWSVMVDGDHTVLQVYEGRIDFANPQGSLAIGGGEAAQARKGEAPTRLVVVSPDEREQMLFYLPLTEVVRYIRPFNGTIAEQIGVRNRLLRIAAEQRSAEDWLELAEAGAELDSDGARLAAIERARSLGLTGSQSARAQLVGGLILLARKQWQAGLVRLGAAMPGLDEPHRAIAAAGVSVARQVADPSSPLTGGDSAPELLAAAFAASYRGDLPLALDLARRGEARFPGNADFVDLEASIAQLLGDREMLSDAVRRGLAIEPDHPGLLAQSAYLKAEYLGNLKGARDDAERATRIAPGNSLAWNILGLVQARDRAPRKAEHAFAEGIRQNPDDATIFANRAVALLDANQVEAAEADIKKALKLDPQESLAYSYEARALIQRGDYRAALQQLLEASAMNPTHAQTLLMLAYVYHRLGERTAAGQQIELAQRYDPLSPFPAAFRSVLDLDDRQVGRSIDESRSAIQVSRRVHREDIRADRFLFDALRQSGLEDWARSSADRNFDPTDAASYFEQAAYNRPTGYLVEPGTVDRVSPANLADPFHQVHEIPLFVGPCFLPQPPMVPPISRCPPPPPPPPPGPVFQSAFLTTLPEAGQSTLPLSPSDALNPADELNFSAALQGLARDPLALASSQRHSRLFHEAFTEVTGSGASVTSNGSTRANATVTARGLSLSPVPFSFTASVSHLGLRNALHDLQQLDSVQASIGSELAPGTTLLVQLGGSRRTDRLNLMSEENLIDGPSGVPLDLSTERERSVKTRGGSVLALLSHDIGILRLTAGGSFSRTRVDTSARDAFTGVFDLGFMTLGSHEEREGRRHAHAELSYLTAGAMLDLAPTTVWVGVEHVSRTTSTRLGAGTGTFQREHGHDQLDRSYVHARTHVGPFILEGDIGQQGSRSEYGAAVRFEPSRNQAISAGYRSHIRSFAPFTLEPVSEAGIVPNADPAALDTRSTVAVLRWEAEWSPRFFSVAEVQRQDHEELLAPATDAFLSKVRSSPYLIEPQYVLVGQGRATRASLTTNWLITRDLALDSTAAFADRGDQYYLPRYFGRSQLVWNAPHGLSASIAATYIGKRRDEVLLAGRRLKSSTLLDASLRWRSPSRRIEAGINLYNALDDRVDVYNDFPRYGRAAVVSLAVTN